MESTACNIAKVVFHLVSESMFVFCSVSSDCMTEEELTEIMLVSISCHQTTVELEGELNLGKFLSI